MVWYGDQNMYVTEYFRNFWPKLLHTRLMLFFLHHEWRFSLPLSHSLSLSLSPGGWYCARLHPSGCSQQGSQLY